VATDWEDGEVGLVDPADQLHVPEDAGVAREVNLLAVLELDDQAGCLAQVFEVVAARGVKSVGQRDLHALLFDRAALVAAFGRLIRKALHGEPVAQLDHRDDRALEALGQLDSLADVVGVAVRERDQVDALGILLCLWALRVLEPGIDVHALAAGGVEPECRVAEPGQ
jgi:hypothetical protein